MIVNQGILVSFDARLFLTRGCTTKRCDCCLSPCLHVSLRNMRGGKLSIFLLSLSDFQELTILIVDMWGIAPIVQTNNRLGSGWQKNLSTCHQGLQDRQFFLSMAE